MSVQFVPVALFLLSVFSNSLSQETRRFFKAMITDKAKSKGNRKDIFSHKNQYWVDSLAFYHAMRDCEDVYIAAHINHALDVLSDAVRLYGVDNLLSSYNGGKDADVVMHLLRAVAAKFEFDNGVKYNPKLVYFAIEDEFPEVIRHLQFTKTLYDLDITQYDCGIIQGLKEHVDKMHSQSESKIAPAFILGTRRGDPNVGDQETFAPSSDWMPVSFMRVNPILNWEYGHVWHFLRTFNLPYCVLYEQGYTSLGKKALTLPNPDLLRTYIDNSGALSVRKGDSYLPAYMLSDWRMERAGRLAKPSSPDALTAVRENSRSTEGLAQLGRCRSRSNSQSNVFGDSVVRSAAMIIIGDEILNGFTTEVNLQVTSNALTSIGIPLKQVSIVSDNEEEIACEVLRMSQRYDVVFTSGGIGPTHDDVTLRAVATALKQEIRLNSEMLAHLEAVQLQLNLSAAGTSGTSGTNGGQPTIHQSPGIHLDDSMMRLAMLPENSTLRFPPPSREVSAAAAAAAGEDVLRPKVWPVLQCENIFVLPGIPQFYAEKMQLIVKHFLPKNKKPITRKIVLDLEERSLVGLLNSLVAEHTEVKFGSYPFVDHPEFKTIITLEGAERRRVEQALAALLRVFPVNTVLRVEKGVAAEHV